VVIGGGETLDNGPAALFAANSFAVLEAAIKDTLPALFDNLIAQDAESRDASLGNRTRLVGERVNEALEVRLEERKEELLGALQEGGNVGQGEKRGEDNL